MLATVIASVTTVLTFIGIFYFIAALWSARTFMRRPGHAGDFSPGVSILKPVKGLDPEMYAAFASHCRQKYTGEYEILFGAASMDDPAVPAIERLHSFARKPARSAVRQSNIVNVRQTTSDQKAKRSVGCNRSVDRISN